MHSSHSVTVLMQRRKWEFNVLFIQGGLMRDQEVIDAADEHNMVMVLTGMRHFRH